MSAIDLILMNKQLTDNPVYAYNGNGDRIDLSCQPMIEQPNFLDTVNSDLLTREGKDFERYMFNGVFVPRVTSILDYCIADSKEFLMKWASSLGSRYNSEKHQTLSVGTKIHEAIAEYFTSGTMYCIKNLDNYTKSEIKKGVNNFMTWYNHVTIDLGWSVEIFISEVPLICPWFGGTADAILIINGKRYIVDFKSSKRIYQEYFIQVSAYKWIVDNFYPNYGPIDGVGILRFDKKLDIYEDIFLETSDINDFQFINHCQQIFSLAIHLYYSMNIFKNETYNMIVRKQNKIGSYDMGKEIRIIIAGGRDFNNFDLMCNSVNSIRKNILSVKYKDAVRTCIVSGKAKGADTLGEEYGLKEGLLVYEFPADWVGLGKRAGFIRNETMGNFAIEDDNYGVLIAFWDGQSKGTKHMIDYAYKCNLEVFIINY